MCRVTSLLLVLSCFVSAEDLGAVFTITVAPNEAKTFVFPSSPTNKPVRITLDSPEASVPSRLLVTVSQNSRVILVHLPTLIDGVAYTRAERTLCPPCPGNDTCPAYPVTVMFLSYSDVNITVSLSVSVVSDYFLSTRNPVTLTVAPNAPQHFMFLFNRTISGVLVKFTSSDTKCAVASLQYATCPDDSSEVPVGTYQWMERVAAISSTRKRGGGAQFFYAVVALPPSGSCASQSALPLPAIPSSNKSVTLELLEPLSDRDYIMGVLVPTIVFVSSYIIAFIWVVVFDWIRFRTGAVFKLLTQRGSGQQQSSRDEPDGRERGDRLNTGVATLRRPAFLSVLSGQYSMEMVQPISPEELSSWDVQRRTGIPVHRITHDASAPGGSHDAPDGSHDVPGGSHDVPDGSHDVPDDPPGEPEGTHDLSNTTHLDQDEYIGQLKFSESLQPHNHFVWFVLSMVILYGIPAYQLVLTYQEQFGLSGDEGICYYNFLCSQSLQITSSFSFVAFNNVYSNIGYIILGVLILLLNHRRRNIHRVFEHQNQALPTQEKLGVPTHFGVYYASGMALMAIGAMSAAYHMCPTRRNYQLDTTFMYVLAGLGMYRLMKARNPDITPKMHHTMFALATLILLVAVGGLYAPEHAGWPIYALFLPFYFLVCVIFAVEIYYRWKVTNWRSAKDTFRQAKCTPVHKPKFMMVIAMVALNFLILLYGFVSRPSDFATYLLFIMIANLVTMLIYYCVVKCFYKEWKMDLESIRPIAYFVLSLSFWGLGIYFYLNAGTNWLETPATSRNGNLDCFVLKFYDYHDCWHFASACALFFTILMLMALDDQQRLTQRNALKVF